jgi:hypothetical protein
VREPVFLDGAATRRRQRGVLVVGKIDCRHAESGLHQLVIGQNLIPSTPNTF